MRRIVFLILLLSTLTAYSQKQTKRAKDALFELHVEDISDTIRFGYSEGARTRDSIDVLVIHSNYFLGQNAFDTSGCISQFKQYNVSPHYLITRNGSVLQMVKENNTAWHAGLSLLPGTNRDSLNNSSIGIEIINSKTQGPNLQQYHALLNLSEQLVKTWGIRYVVRHSDIAPGRKSDPWLLNWKQFKRDLLMRVDDKLFFPQP